MKNLFIVVLLALAPLMSSSWARAQQANEAETRIVGEIAKCLLAGLPKDWQRAHVIVDLDAPGAAGGGVRYLFSRVLTQDKLEPFTPCDEREPAKALVELRRIQPPARSGWQSARFVLNRDGKFDLTYDYPK